MARTKALDAFDLPTDLPEGLSLQAPPEEVARRAVDSLRGYIYQVYQSLDAWLTLGDDETLLLEVAEDFAVRAKHALTATQVKDTGASRRASLRTKSVLEVINTLWRFQHANLETVVRINYLTTSEIGTERGLRFPGGHSGLTYWRVAAREGADVEPLRQTLLNLKLLPEILDFIERATPEELRTRILERITWICGAGDLTAVDGIIRDRLVYLGEHLGFGPAESERAKDALMVALLTAIVRERANDRTVSRADLLRAFEKSLTIPLPTAAIRKMVGAVSQSQGGVSTDVVSGTGVLVRIADVPLPPRAIERKAFVSELISGMATSGSLWLHGSSGLGKTVLAQLIARRSAYEWSLVQLRGCSAEEFEFRLYRTLQTLQTRRIGGVVLDDLPTQYLHRARLRLSMLAEEVRRMNGSLLITSTKAPSPNVQDCFGQNGLFVIDVPYLSREEVAELVTLAGGDPNKWAAVVHGFCGFGHPQLVQARISGLRQRGWPDSDLLSGFIKPATEVNAERASIRERLLSELAPSTRELLYRLSLAVGYFDQGMANAIAEVNQAIDRPGEEMNILRGAWIETLGSDCFRVSPLVGNVGLRTLSKSVQLAVHRTIVDELLTRHPFPAEFLGILLVHGLASAHVTGLAWLAMAIMNVRDRDAGIVSEHLFLLPLLDTHQPLVKEDAYVSAMLRLAQFRVASWASRTDQLPEIADRLVAEARMIQNREIAPSFLFLAISSTLVEKSLRISPGKWLPLIEEFDLLIRGEGVLMEQIRELRPIKRGLDGWTASQFLFVIRATSLQSTDELAELFTQLDHLNEDSRKTLLSSLDALPHGRRLIVDVPWLAEKTDGKLDGVAAARKYAQAAAVAEKWGEEGITVECECARAVMLSEYAGDSEAAIRSLEEAEKKHPKNARLLRERAKIYYSKGNHSAALAIIEQVADAIPEHDHIERAFALREAAISAAKTGRLPDADGYFAKAYSAAAAVGSPAMRRMSVGLKADRALVKFQSGGRADAIRLVREAIIDAEQLDPKADTKAGFCGLTLPLVIVWMQAQVEKTPPTGYAQYDFPLLVGSCSNPDPPDTIMGTPYPPLLASWYQLTILELMLGADSGILSELRKRTSTREIVFCELVLNHYVMTKYIVAVDFDSFFSYLPEYVSKTAYMKENSSAFDRKNAYNLTDRAVSPIRPADWQSELHLENAKDAILALTAAALTSEVADIKGQLLRHVHQHDQSFLALRPFLDCFGKETCPKGDAFGTTAHSLGHLMKADTSLSPDEMFLTTYRIWEWLPHTNFKDAIEDIIADYLGRRWAKIIDRQRFQLRRPMVTVPAIQAAVEGTTKGITKISRLLLAAEMAVKYTLGTDPRSRIQKGISQGN
jgi:tetratricopeptide (TPR) repeat protein